MSTPRHDSTPEHARRRLLLVTFHYPPSNSSSGGLRPLTFSRYLHEFGWDATVLTVPERCHDATDPALLAQIPPWVTVHRARCYDTKRDLSIRGRYPQLLAIPDRFTSWIPFAVRAGRALAGRQSIGAVLSTSPIPSAHLAAYGIVAGGNIPWIADFRDPWVETEGNEVYGALRQRAELALERAVIRRASVVTATTPELGTYLRDRYPVLAADKIRAVYNGFEEDDFINLTPQPTEASFSIVHAGLLDPHYRNPTAFLRAFRTCLDTGVLPRDARAVFLGAGPWGDGGALAEIVGTLGLSDSVRIESRVPYRTALARLAGASSLLLLQGGDDTRMLIPAKAFEYLRTGRLILNAAPPASATGQLTAAFSGTFVASPDDSVALTSQLSALVSAWRSGQHLVDRTREGLMRFSRRSAAAALAEILDGLVPAARAGTVSELAPTVR